MVDSSQEPKEKGRGSTVRLCAACRNESAPDELIRWVRDDEGRIYPDLRARSSGRGAWTHPQSACLANLPKSLARSFRAPVTTTQSEALDLLAQAAAHFADQLLGAARRQNKLVFGNDATGEAWALGRVDLIVVAQDAQAAAQSKAVDEAVRSGKACVWGTKERLGALFGRPAVGVVGVCNRGLAKSLFGAIAMALRARGEHRSQAKT